MPNKPSVKRILSGLLLCLCVSSCSSYSGLFPNGKTWSYKIDFYNKNSELEDSTLMRMVVKSNWVAALSNQIPIVYYYSLDGLSYEENTGAIDNKDHISVHSPRFGALNFTEVLPMPTLSKPFGAEFTSISETTVSKSTMKILSGKTINQKSEYVGKDSLVLFGKTIPCFKIKAENTDLYELVGHYVAYYWFNDRYGFVRFQYIKPSGEKVNIQLIKEPYSDN